MDTFTTMRSMTAEEIDRLRIKSIPINMPTSTIFNDFSKDYLRIIFPISYLRCLENLGLSVSLQKIKEEIKKHLIPFKLNPEVENEIAKDTACSVFRVMLSPDYSEKLKIYNFDHKLSVSIDVEKAKKKYEEKEDEVKPYYVPEKAS